MKQTFLLSAFIILFTFLCQISYGQVIAKNGNAQLTEQDINTYIMAVEYNTGYAFNPQYRMQIRNICIQNFNQNPNQTFYIMRVTVQQAINKQAAMTQNYQGRSSYQQSAEGLELQSKLIEQNHNINMRIIHNMGDGYEETYESGSYYDNW